MLSGALARPSLVRLAEAIMFSGMCPRCAPVGVVRRAQRCQPCSTSGWTLPVYGGVQSSGRGGGGDARDRRPSGGVGQGARVGGHLVYSSSSSGSSPATCAVSCSALAMRSCSSLSSASLTARGCVGMCAHTCVRVRTISQPMKRPVQMCSFGRWQRGTHLALDDEVAPLGLDDLGHLDQRGLHELDPRLLVERLRRHDVGWCRHQLDLRCRPTLKLLR